VLNCVWSETSLDPDSRSHYAIATLVNNALDRAELGFIHRNGFKQLPADADGAVVIIHGEHQVSQVDEVMDGINRLKWSVIIVIGDDMAQFPSDKLLDPRRKVWLQMPVPRQHDRIDRKLICGYPHDAPAYIALCEKELRDKPLNWFYSGQVNHLNRRQCVAQLKMMPAGSGFLNESPGFWSGLPRDEYYRKLASCKVAPCPTGAATPDTLRLGEALEAGCVPIVEDRWPPGFPRKGQPGLTGYWRYVLGEEPPFPTLVNWADFPALYEKALSGWPSNRDQLQEWWRGYKQKMWAWLKEDVDTARRWTGCWRP
jgi:hypothetical protein